MSTSDLISEFILPNYGRFAIAPVRGKGCELWDENGKRYLDFAQGVAVNSLGHCHPVLVDAIRKQSETLIHCSNLYQIPGQAALAQFLSEKVIGTPGKSFFCNSGAEANEALIKLARRFGQLNPTPDGSPRFEILSFLQSFHGRTTGGMAATGQPRIYEGFGPLMPGFRHLPFNDPDTLRAAPNKDTVAILIEVIQGEGGIRVASREFLDAAAEICREQNLLLLLDEVQCGIGRSGEFAGWKSVSPDIVPHAVSWAKGIGGGFPVGAIWVSDAPAGSSGAPLSSVLSPGTHGSTFGGSPLACAVGLAVLQEVENSHLRDNASTLGNYVKDLFSTSPHPLVTEVRGFGLMLGFALDSDRFSSAPNFADSGKSPSIFAVTKLMDHGLLTVPAGPDVVRWLPPLNVTKAEIDEANTILRRVFDTLVS